MANMQKTEAKHKARASMHTLVCTLYTTVVHNIAEHRIVLVTLSCILETDVV